MATSVVTVCALHVAPSQLPLEWADHFSMRICMTQLRHLDLTVEEHDYDEFFWTILETMTGHTAEHSSAVHGDRTWKEA
ncbi:MAG: hypothetical protein KKC79_11350 [Gammaproteobacteria bacterium]|nr:hypothetical protein [Gammaproteobacteria bacterium]MBU1443867.1 hypothetical protein [Gammaproteobacteria bacterium]MBU2409225.1 hypothetical protein [Gammaproteobacteria bacterium]